MKRRSISSMRRLKILEAANNHCHICALRIDSGQLWDVEHVRPLALGGLDDDHNLAPAHRHCHAPKTVEDIGRISKAKRQAAKHVGASQSRNPMPGSKRSKWKRKMDGTTVLRSRLIETNFCNACGSYQVGKVLQHAPDCAYIALVRRP